MSGPAASLPGPVTIHFPGLNGIRFIAALAVIIHHTERTKHRFGHPSWWNRAAVENMGGLGVTMFFVLSGFLITYLLLVEKEETGTISIRYFYIRRVLRIWPLYLWIVMMSLFVIPHIDYLSMPGLTNQVHRHLFLKTLLFLFMLPNVAVSLGWLIPYASQAWSIGVEEQFYLVWPLLLHRVRRYVPIMIGIIVVLAVLPGVLALLSGDTLHFGPSARRALTFLSAFFSSFRIGCMAVGGIAAHLAYVKHRSLRFFFDWRVQVAVVILLMYWLGTGRQPKYLVNEFYSVLFAIVILNVACNPKVLVNLEREPFHYLGKISYGLYMYHVLCIVVVIHVAETLRPSVFTSTPGGLFLLVVATALTTVVAALSYSLLERPFLKLKPRAAFITSRD